MWIVWSGKGVVRRRKIEGGRVRHKLSLMIGTDMWVVEEREEVTEDSRSEGRSGVLRRAENQPRREEEEREGGVIWPVEE